MQRRAFNLIPPRFEDKRHEAIEDGLKRHGYAIKRDAVHDPRAGDVMTCWNLHASHVAEAAVKIKAAGGRVVVAEEAYTRWTWPTKHFALALDGHNGSGRWYANGPARWDKMKLELKPWREAGEEILVREQRGIGNALMRSPPDWHGKTMEKLKALTQRPIRLRLHPANQKPARVPFEIDAARTHALVTWASTDGVRALIEGIPVFALAPHYIAAAACNRDVAKIDAPDKPDRLPALHRMAWAQWTMDEIARGVPFEFLLRI